MLNDEAELEKYKGTMPAIKNQILKSMKLQKSILLGKNPISQKIQKQKINPDIGLDYF
jgi:hypothetical protein